MGKILIEKLLRSCPDINKIYALIRPGRNGESGQQRLDKLHTLAVFDRLKKERPGQIETKLIAIEGDIYKEQLGLSIADRQLLIKEVSIVYHAAATVRFDQPLQEAILLNVRGTREVCELVLDIRKHNPDTILEHLSTAYAHSERKVIEEHLYPPHADWRWSIQIAETLDTQTIQILTAKYMSIFPNTYTFTKSMAEHVVNDLCGKGGNTVIVRPSVVTNTYQEPVEGWVDNLNGPVGILSAVSSGVVRTTFMNGDAAINYVPVDTAIKLMVLATWRLYLDKRNGTADLSQARVHNCCLISMPIDDIFKAGEDIIWKLQLDDTIWFPSFSLTTNFSWFYINFLLFQLLPAFVIDKGLALMGKSKRSLVKIQRKIYIASRALAHFVQNEWDFKIDTAMSLEHYLSDKEAKIWGYELDGFNWADYCYDSCLGVKQHVMKESIGDPKKYLRKRKMMYYLDYVVKTLFVGVLISFLYTESSEYYNRI